MIGLLPGYDAIGAWAPTLLCLLRFGQGIGLGGILGASFAPYIAQRLVTEGGLAWVGGYVSLAAAISLFAVWMMRETPDNPWV